MLVYPFANHELRVKVVTEIPRNRTRAGQIIDVQSDPVCEEGDSADIMPFDQVSDDQEAESA
jgi:hypothetical protein